jgi:hypothetical protein
VDYKQIEHSLDTHKGSEYSKGYRTALRRYIDANVAVNKKIGYKGHLEGGLSHHNAKVNAAKFKDDRALKHAVVNTVGLGVVGGGLAHKLKASPKVSTAIGAATSGLAALAIAAHKHRTKKRLAEATRVRDAFKKETE